MVKNVTVTVPAELITMNLRMTGYGEGGSNGGENGDLYLRFRVKPHKVFERKKDDILLTVPISLRKQPWEIKLKFLRFMEMSI